MTCMTRCFAWLGCAAVVLSGCGGGSGGGSNPTEVQGQVDVPTSPVFNPVREIEHNAGATCAQDLGNLGPGQFVSVAGTIDTQVNDQDVFRFKVTGPIDLSLVAQFTTSQNIDLDLAVFTVKGSDPPVPVGTATTQQKSSESLALTIDDPSTFDFLDVVLFSKDGMQTTNYILNVTADAVTLRGGPRLSESAKTAVDPVHYADLDRIPMRDGELILKFREGQAADVRQLEVRWGLEQIASTPGRFTLYRAPWI